MILTMMLCCVSRECWTPLTRKGCCHNRPHPSSSNSLLTSSSHITSYIGDSQTLFCRFLGILLEMSYNYKRSQQFFWALFTCSFLRLAWSVLVWVKILTNPFPNHVVDDRQSWCQPCSFHLALIYTCPSPGSLTADCDNSDDDELVVSAQLVFHRVHHQMIFHIT